MSKERFKTLVIAILIVAIVSMSVVYALLSQTLNINTSAKVVKSNSWNVFFDSTSISEPTLVGYAEVEEGKELQISGTTTLQNLEVTLKAPGDSVTYTFEVKNTGAIDAKISTVELPNLANATYQSANNVTSDINLVKQYLRYSLTYASDEAETSYRGKALATDDTLSKNSSRKLKLTISYDSSATDIPSEAVTVSGLNARVNYVQY
ncbi:MAG: hypothetical protein IIZ40_02230 [Bacilli bacterium]|nr:hypothetical protein [Bacilli bacterium]